MTTVQLLEAAKEKINTPEKWCKHAFGATEDGRPVSGRSSAACKWCASEAINLFAVTGDSNHACKTAFFRANGTMPLVLNDNPATTHADVMAAFDKAIALAKQEAAS